MPVVGLALDELFHYLGRTMPAEELENELHRFGCSVEGWAELARYRCPSCEALLEAAEQEPPPASCEVCGADLRERELERVGSARVLRMELLAVRPDLFDPPGLARALRGFLGLESGAPRYELGASEYVIEVDAALEGPEVRRPRIVGAIVRGLDFDDAKLRGLMKLQENIHWALGRDRKLASIGVYDLARVEGTRLSYRATPLDAPRFVPLGFDQADPKAALTPAQVLAEHPKGKAFARLLAGATRAPLLSDEEGGVLSMPPIINSEATRVSLGTREVLIDVTGLADRHVERALNIVATSLLEAHPGARLETLRVRYEEGPERVTPDLAPTEVRVDPEKAARLIGCTWSGPEVRALLERMRHDVDEAGEGSLSVRVPAWRADILHPRDLAEDAAIAHGYDNIAPLELTRATYGAAHPVEERLGRARRALVGQGFLEVMTLALSSESASYGQTRLPEKGEHVALEHPISVEQTMVRVSTLPGLLETLAVNLTRPYPQRVFETGLVAKVDPELETGAREHARASLALAGDGFGFADVRAAVDALLRDLGLEAARLRYEPLEEGTFMAGRAARVVVGEREIGVLGEAHPEVLEAYRIIHPVALAELDLDLIDALA